MFPSVSLRSVYFPSLSSLCILSRSVSTLSVSFSSVSYPSVSSSSVSSPLYLPLLFLPLLFLPVLFLPLLFLPLMFLPLLFLYLPLPSCSCSHLHDGISYFALFTPSSLPSSPVTRGIFCQPSSPTSPPPSLSDPPVIELLRFWSKNL